jgi:antitoxin component YwqK of YwqJK toxin-antitoxin module
MLHNNVLFLSQIRIMTKTAFMLLILMGLTVCTFSQSRKYDHFADAKLNLSKEAGAAYGVISTLEEGLYKLDFYNHYKDASGKKMEGLSISYHGNGKIEWKGNYKNNQFDMLWLQTDTMGRITDSVIYDRGKLQYDHTIAFYPNGKLREYSIANKINGTYEEKAYTENGALQSEMNFAGKTGTAKEYDSLGHISIRPLTSTDEVEASFPGGAKEFRKFLEQNLNANTPVDNGAPAGIYTVIVKFVVGKDGSISDITAETNHGFGMEKEVIRMIRLSPKWEPAMQHGRKVNAYRRQPVTFVVEEEKRRRRN